MVKVSYNSGQKRFWETVKWTIFKLFILQYYACVSSLLISAKIYGFHKTFTGILSLQLYLISPGNFFSKAFDV